MGKLRSATLLILVVLGVSVLMLPKPSMAAVLPLVYVTPTPIEAEPNTEFTIDVKIKYAEDVYAWEFKLMWNASVLSYVNASEGSFLKGMEVKPTYWVNPVVYQNGSGVLLGCTRLGAGIMGASGSGTLATIKLKVLSKGETTLDLKDTKLRDSYPNPIDHTSKDGLFSNVAGFPRPDFSFTPAKANIGETITFDASNSSDVNEGGYIVAYYWDFGDNTNSSDVSPVAYHSYTAGGIYDVTLTVTDNDNWNKSVTEAAKVRFPYDVMIVEVKESVENAVAGDVVSITVKLSNEGANELTGVNVKVYYEKPPIESTQFGDTQTVSLAVDQVKTLSFDWNTKDMSAGNYRLKAIAGPVEGEPEEAKQDNTKLGGTIALTEAPQTPWMLYGGIIGGVAVVAVVGGFLFMRRRGNNKKQGQVS